MIRKLLIGLAFLAVGVGANAQVQCNCNFNGENGNPRPPTPPQNVDVSECVEKYMDTVSAYYKNTQLASCGDTPTSQWTQNGNGTWSLIVYMKNWFTQQHCQGQVHYDVADTVDTYNTAPPNVIIPPPPLIPNAQGFFKRLIINMFGY